MDNAETARERLWDIRRLERGREGGKTATFVGLFAD